jgi:broad-specificity NMP kinase
MVRAIVITGSPGAGKSSVLEALGGLLEADGIPHARFESEQLACGHPWLAEEDAYDVLAVTCRALRDKGRELFIVAGTTETDAHVDALKTAIGAAETTVVCLTAAPDTTARRVLDREPAEWLGREPLAAHSRVLATQIPSLDGIDVHITTEGRHPRDVAREVRSKALQGV